MKPSPYFKKRAFSLVEILVVMIIIAVLCALLLPWTKKGLASANQARCIGNVHQLCGALIAFRSENNGQLVPMGISGGGGYNPSGIIESYLGNKDIPPGTCVSRVWSCPSNPASPAGSSPPWSESGVSYALNAYLIDWPNMEGYHAALAQNPGKLLLIMERDPTKVVGTALGINHLRCGSGGGYYGHGQGNTVGFVDGHVESWPMTHEGFAGPDGYGVKYDPYWLIQ